MTEREKILARIREALTVCAPVPGHGDEAGVMYPPAPSSAGARQWLPVVGETFQARLDLFQKNAADLKANFNLVNSHPEMLQLLLELRDAEGWKKVGSHQGAM